MPGRNIPLVTAEFYHIFNRGVASQPIFGDRRDFRRALQTIFYYQNVYLPQKYSLFLTQAKATRQKILTDLRKKAQFLVEINAYCLLPNHFHFLLRQLVDGGVAKFIGDFSNSYTRYFNTRHQREGPLLTGKFKAVRVETKEQLQHLSRYIHLNPYSSYLVKRVDDLMSYPYSSFGEYLGKAEEEFCQKEVVLNPFAKKENYQKFVLNQADYQRRLAAIKHLALE